MNPKRFFIFVSFLLCGCAVQRPLHSFPELSELRPQPDLPNPLVALDGHVITTSAQWFNERRPELKALFGHYMYGPIPPKPASMQIAKRGDYQDFLDNQATLKLRTLQIGPGNGPRIDLILVIPNLRDGPAPVFLAMNFCGNHALTTDLRVPLAQTWLGNNCINCTNNSATEAARGTQVADWPLAEIVRRGYALAVFYNGDVDSDRAQASTGLYAWLNENDPAQNNPTNRGTIAAWAWGFQRCVDYLVTDPDVDARHIASLGHSRNGKTALLAAAFDDRIAMAFPHQAGCGGTAPSRGKTGESVKVINDHFPHWFNAEFKKFNDLPERLPFDQNCLVALCAPRPVLFSAAQDDQWANPAGQFQVLQAADSVYHLLGVQGLTELHRGVSTPIGSQSPPTGQLIGGRLGYYLREGKHSMGRDDWRVFLDFADKQWGKPKSK